MPADGAKFLAAYRKVDAKCVAAGGPATSPAWLDALSHFWLSGRLRMVVRKGRQVGASTIVAPRITATVALVGDFTQARGTRGTIGFSSTRQKEADERLYNIERTFFDLGVKVKPKGDTIEVPRRPVIIQSYPSSTEVARGANSWMWWEDEMPAWKDGDGVNPSSDRDAAIVPTLAMHDNARIYSVGTPVGELDYHASLINRGDTASQCVFSGPSWYWNPTLTEERTHELEPDARRHAREFGAQPIEADGESVFAPTAIDRCTRATGADLPREGGVTYVVAMDPALSRNSWTLAVAALRMVDGRLRRSVVCVRQWTGTPAKPLDPFDVLREVKAICVAYGARIVLTDQHHGASLAAIGRRPEIDLIVSVEPTTAASKLAGYEDMLTRLIDGEIDLPRDAHVRADLRAVRRVPLRSGGLSIQLVRIGARHADYASAIALALGRCVTLPALTSLAQSEEVFWARLDAAMRVPPRPPDPVEVERQCLAADLRSARNERKPAGKWWQRDPTRAAGSRRSGLPRPPF